MASTVMTEPATRHAASRTMTIARIETATSIVEYEPARRMMSS